MEKKYMLIFNLFYSNMLNNEDNKKQPQNNSHD